MRIWPICADWHEPFVVVTLVDWFVTCQFVEGLPEATRLQMRALKSGGKWRLGEVFEAAKSMLRQTDLQVSGGFFDQVVGTSRNNGVATDDLKGRGGLRYLDVQDVNGRGT